MDTEYHSNMKTFLYKTVETYKVNML